MVAHFNVLVRKCTQFREEGIFTDVQLKVGRTLFPAHRIILAAFSDYFYAMFTNGMKETNQEVIELRDESMSSETFKQIVDYIYSGNLRINSENVFQVLAAADHLQITSVLQECSDFLKRELLQDELDVRWYSYLYEIAEKYDLRELREAAESKMALNYHAICESREFLTHMSTEKFFSLLSRDDLTAPSETFVFKSVMQWIKHKRERMAVAAKVIGAVRLGLVDVKVLIHELNTRDFQRLPDIHMILFDAAIYFHVPSQVPRFADKSKPRAPSQVLVAITHGKKDWSSLCFKAFDVVSKSWKMTALTPLRKECDIQLTAEQIGNHLYVAVDKCTVYCYSIDQNLWEELPRSPSSIKSLCAIGDYMYALNDSYQIPQRYSFSECQWQPIAKVHDRSNTDRHYSAGATVFDSKLYALFGRAQRTEENNRRGSNNLSMLKAKLHCFDPSMNHWKFLSNTCEPHFGSTLFVVNNKLCVAGGNKSVSEYPLYVYGEEASVEVYNVEAEYWSTVHQSRIPQNSFGAIEVEGRVYFIINKFAIDSGIRIPPEERYPVHLGDWEKLDQVDRNAALCYLPVKRKP